jgi:hypothetical protein
MLSPGLIAVIVLLVVVAYVLWIFILKASCAVVDVKEPGYVVAAILALVVMAAVVASATLFGWLLGRFDPPDSALGPYRLAGGALGVVIVWLLAGMLHWALMAKTPVKGLWLAAIELLLNGLAWSLLFGLFLFGFSIYQWATSPPDAGKAAVVAPARPISVPV